MASFCLAALWYWRAHTRPKLLSSHTAIDGFLVVVLLFKEAIDALGAAAGPLAFNNSHFVSLR